MIRSIIIDDEPIGRDLLTALLEQYCPNVSVVAQADSIRLGRDAIRRYEPDLLFLDVEMPRGNGFQLLEQIQDRKFEVIFTTAYEQYAIRAIKAAALDYLLKPISSTELVAAVARAERRRGSAMGMHQGMEALLETLRGTGNEQSKLALPTEEGLIVVSIGEIVRCEASASYTWFHFTSGERRLVSRPLKEFEQILGGSRFLRVHHSHMVNVDHIRRYVRGEGGEVVMSDHSSVVVARRKKEDLLKMLGAERHRRGG